MLIDTHAHIHMEPYSEDCQTVIERAQAEGVNKIISVGVDDKDSQAAIKLANGHDNIWASVGLHPHDANLSERAMDTIKMLAHDPKVVAIGECGLDYHYENSPKDEQKKALKAQIELALEVGKPVIFHVREAFDDFFATLENYQGVQGVVHSFTGEEAILNKVLDHGLFVAYNGIITFTKQPEQLEAAKECPLDRMLLETDCPFLTPAPHRGQRNEPANVKIIAEFLANLRGDSFDEIAAASTKNAEKLFGI